MVVCRGSCKQATGSRKCSKEALPPVHRLRKGLVQNKRSACFFDFGVEKGQMHSTHDPPTRAHSEGGQSLGFYANMNRFRQSTRYAELDSPCVFAAFEQIFFFGTWLSFKSSLARAGQQWRALSQAHWQESEVRHEGTFEFACQGTRPGWALGKRKEAAVGVGTCQVRAR